jgi:dTDP-4-dehydrorhamnose 3,5-epimerase
MEKIDTPLKDLFLIKPKIFHDYRGFLFESYNKKKFEDLGISTVFVQDNHSHSVKNTIRALHFQKNPPQAKLVRSVTGKIWDVAVDLRPDSPTFSKWFGQELSDENNLIMYIPAGFAHGFCALSEKADVLYRLSSIYNPQSECGIIWNDPDIDIKWPVTDPILSDRDKKNPTFKSYINSMKK